MSLRPFIVGPHTFTPNLILAPMSGVTNSAFRRLIRECNPGCVGLVITEFISVEGLTRGSAASRQMMAFREEEHPIAIQIFGHDIERMADAAAMAEDAGADIVDLNCGCPVPKVVKRGGGCELMRQPEHLGRMLTAVRKRIRVPLTMKMRSGWDEGSRNVVEVARIAADAGVEMITVHGRTRKMLYRGLADWEIIQEVAQAVSIPVVGSGDVVDLASARERLHGGVAAVMIGRGALMNPWIFREIASEWCGTPIPRPSAVAIIEVLDRYRELLSEVYSERAMLGKLKQFASQVARGVRDSGAIRRTLCTSSTVGEFALHLRRFRVLLTYPASESLQALQ